MKNFIINETNLNQLIEVLDEVKQSQEDMAAILMVNDNINNPQYAQEHFSKRTAIRFRLKGWIERLNNLTQLRSIREDEQQLNESLMRNKFKHFYELGKLAQQVKVNHRDVLSTDIEIDFGSEQYIQNQIEGAMQDVNRFLAQGGH